MTKHTPGPWRVGPVDDTLVSDASGREVAAVDGDYNNPDEWPSMEANARLIAAAPEMYAELRKLADALNSGRQLDTMHFMPSAIARINSIVAKAEGQP